MLFLNFLKNKFVFIRKSDLLILSVYNFSSHFEVFDTKLAKSVSESQNFKRFLKKRSIDLKKLKAIRMNFDKELFI